MNKNSVNIYRKVQPYLILILVIVLLDQVVKLLAFHYMEPGSSGEIQIIGNFFKLHLVQNAGMAFGINLDSRYGKLILSLVRLGITVALIWYFFKTMQSGGSSLFLICLSLIIAGAIGNGIDSTFYGVFLDNAPANSPFPWLHGKVVDMFYINIWKGHISESVPVIGGSYLSLWPIFNIADAAVSIGVVFIIIFQKKIFDQP